MKLFGYLDTFLTWEYHLTDFIIDKYPALNSVNLFVFGWNAIQIFLFLILQIISLMVLIYILNRYTKWEPMI